MIEDDVITRLVELHDHIQAPPTPVGEDALRGERLVRRRRMVSVVAVSAALVLAVGLAQASLSGDQRELQPAPAPSSPAPSDPVEPLRVPGDPFATEFNKIVVQVPDWSIADTQEMFDNGPCAGDWTSAAEGGSGGDFDVRTNGEPGLVWQDMMGFTSAAQASAAVNRLIRNLASCTTVVWQIEQIARTGAVLASSADGLIWVQHRGKHVSTLSAVTNDGPPPLDVQVEIADLMSSSLE